MLKYLCIIPFVFITNLTLGQNQQILDSVYSELKTNNTHESRFSSYRKLFQLYYKSNNIEKCKTAMDSLSNLIPMSGFEKGTVALTKALYYSRISKLDTAIGFNEEAIIHLVGEESNINRSRALSNMGLIQRRKGDYEAAIKYTLQSLHLKDSKKKVKRLILI